VLASLSVRQPNRFQVYAYGDKPDRDQFGSRLHCGDYPQSSIHRRQQSAPDLWVGVPFLEVHGFRFTATEENATRAILGLTAGELDEAAFASWLSANVTPPRR
jgi:hypothetical protein